MHRLENYLRRAIGETGVEDFGGDSFKEGLDRLLWAVDTEAALSPRGQQAFDKMILKALVNRLEIQHWYSAHPEIDDQEITAPLIGLGLPRTGSTAFFQMLSMDPAVRTIRSWEGTRPCPPPVRGSEESDPRVLAAAREQEEQHKASPRLKTMLSSSATSALECGVVMSYEFKSNLYSAMFHVPSYSAWIAEEADMTSAYRFLKQVLKLLQWRCPPRRWRLKSPPHSRFINALNAVFPDAKFWMTHRDICRVIPSVADLYFAHALRFSDQVDKAYLGDFNAEFWESALRTMIDFRDRGNEHRFYDVYFDQFQKDPFPSIAGIYDFLREELTEETRERIQVWREEMPRGKHGEHKYNAADFGIDPDRLNNKFEFYSRRFRVVPESPVA